MRCDTAQQWADQTKAAMIHFLRLEYLYTDFLLNTLLASSSEISRESMLITAQEILKAVLLPTRKRYLLHGHRADMEWAVSGEVSKVLNQIKLRILTYIAASVLCHALC